MITIIADENNCDIGRKLQEGFLTKHLESNFISLENVEVKPCYSCGGCTYKTYGECVFRDDDDWILRKIIKSDTLILVTPVTFGSYSFKVKRVFDKFGLIGDRHYQVINRELVKGGIQGELKNIFAVGVKDNCKLDEKAAFEALVRENLIITTALGKSYVVNTNISNETINRMVEEMSV
jgi:multimeric flavodoxin WrbA